MRRTASRELYERGEIGRTLPVWRQIAPLPGPGCCRSCVVCRGPRPACLRGLCLVGLLAVGTAGVDRGRPAPTPHVGAGRHPRGGAAAAVAHRHTLARARLEQLPPGPSIVVANHASYIDGIVLTAALPGVSASSPSANSPRAWCRACFAPHRRRVRGAFRDAAWRRDARSLARTALAGKTLIFFPEGTFTRTPGLRAFHLGAFAAR